MNDAAADTFELLKREFGVGHGFACCVSEWRRCFPSVDTPSLKSMDYVMTKHKIAFDLAHRAVR